jgi:hypothetical protein
MGILATDYTDYADYAGFSHRLHRWTTEEQVIRGTGNQGAGYQSSRISGKRTEGGILNFSCFL